MERSFRALVLTRAVLIRCRLERPKLGTCARAGARAMLGTRVRAIETDRRVAIERRGALERP